MVTAKKVLKVVVLPLFLCASLHAEERTWHLAEQVFLEAGQSEEWRFNLTPPAEAEQARLTLEGRIEHQRLAGSTPILQVRANDTYLTAGDLLNKALDLTTAAGSVISWNNASLWRLLYSPDFASARSDKTSPYRVIDGDPYRFAFNITPYVKPGKNVVWVRHFKRSQRPIVIELRNVAVVLGKPTEKPQAPPTELIVGKLREYVPRPSKPIRYEVRLSKEGAIEISMGKISFAVESEFSRPGDQSLSLGTSADGTSVGQGQAAAVAYKTEQYALRRVLRPTPEKCDVLDTIQNLSSETIGVRLKHCIKLDDAPIEVRLCGLPACGGRVGAKDGGNPTSFARFRDFSVGLVAVDDVFRVHAASHFRDGELSLSDDELALPGRASYTLEWSIYPVTGDYWSFLNIARRACNANFTIPGPFCFMGHVSFDEKSPVEEVHRWIRSRDIKILATTIPQYANGKYAHGTGLLHAPQWVAKHKALFSLIRQACPDVTLLVYFHAQVSTEPNAEELYRDGRLLDSSGNQMYYPYSYPLPIFVPTLENSYGKAVWKFLSVILDEIGADGIYWDEMAYSVTPYQYSDVWDGHTAVIDPKTHGVRSLRPMVPLLMQPWKLELVRKVRSRGKMIIGNTPPVTRTMADLHISRFTETGDYQRLWRVHLSSPIGLGNHTTETDQQTAARHLRRILDFGCVYYNHLFMWDPPPENFHRYMFPITPVEIHAGVVIGRERILTSRPGIFGWGDSAVPAVHVFDQWGNRVADAETAILRDGNEVRVEIRLPTHCVAAIVRKD